MVSQANGRKTTSKNFIFHQRHQINGSSSYATDKHTIERGPFPDLFKITKENDVALFVALVSAISVVLKKYLKRDHIILETPELLKEESGNGEERVSLDVNVKGEATFRQLLNDVQKLASSQYSSCKKKGAKSNVFLQFSGVHKAAENYEEADLIFYCTKEEEGLSIQVKYRKNCFEKFFAHNFFKHLGQVLNHLADPDSPINKIDIIPADERNLLIHGINDTAKVYEPNKTLTQVFKQIVEAFPSKTALLFENERCSYQELDQRSSLLAQQLTEEHDLAHGKVIGVMLDRSIDWIVSVLGVLKAGGIYVPLDTNAPEERKYHILENSGVELVITSSDYMFDLGNFSGEIFAIDIQLDISGASDIKFEDLSTPDQVAYHIYTSGSTGQPKGVPIKHSSILDRILYHIDYLNISSEDNLLQMASPVFDASLVEIFMSLCAGASLVISSGKDKNDINRLLTLLNEQAISVAIFPPAYLKALDKTPLNTLRMIISTGEAANLESTLHYSRDIKIYNGYGPTETCIGATFYEVSSDKLAEYQQNGSIPIGTPFANTQAYLLDENLSLVPMGLAGEVCVAGIGLSPGYLNHESNGSENFVKNPFSSGNNDRLYRTGDIARFNAHGELEYLGRIDEQVQINGIRIEPGEIERKLTEIEGIKEAAVKAYNNDNDIALTAFLLADDAMAKEEVKKQLEKTLPHYMIPNRLILVDEIPVTASGKRDWQTLEKASEQIMTSVQEPVSDTEKLLVTLFKKILESEEVGLDSDFFELGGNSLKAIQLVSEINKSMSLSIEVKDVFDNAKVSVLADLLSHQEPSAAASIIKLPEADAYEASHAQKAAWSYNQRLLDQGISNATPGKFYIHGPLDQALFTASLFKIIERHESLRTVFFQDQWVLRQKVMSAQEFDFKCTFSDFSIDPDKTSKVEEIMALERNNFFQLETGPLIRTQLIKMEDELHVFILVLHHAAADGTSMNIFFHELNVIYSALTSGQLIDLPELPVQYRDFTFWQNRALENPETQEIRDFWTNELNEAKGKLSFESDGVETLGEEFQSDLTLSSDALQSLGQNARNNGVTLFMQLVTTTALLLKDLTNQDDFVIGLPVSGRQQKEVDHLMGNFANDVVFRIRLDPTDDFKSTLVKVKAKLELIYNHQEYPLFALFEEPVVTPEVSVNFQNFTNVNKSANNEPLKIAAEQVQKSGNVTGQPLSFVFTEYDDALKISLFYDPKRFSQNKINDYLRRFEDLLKEGLKTLKSLEVA